MRRSIDDAAGRLRRALDRSTPAPERRPGVAGDAADDDWVRRAFLEPDAALVPAVGSRRRSAPQRPPEPAPADEPAPVRADEPAGPTGRREGADAAGEARGAVEPSATPTLAEQPADRLVWAPPPGATPPSGGTPSALPAGQPALPAGTPTLAPVPPSPSADTEDGSLDSAASLPVIEQPVPRSVVATTDDFLDGLRRRVERRP